VIKVTKLTDAFDFDAFRHHHGDKAVPLFVLDDARGLSVLTPDAPAAPRPGVTVISLVDPAPAAAVEAVASSPATSPG
jgi:hypothetical protein